MAQNGILIGRYGTYCHMWWIIALVMMAMLFVGCSDSSTGTTEEPGDPAPPIEIPLNEYVFEVQARGFWEKEPMPDATVSLRNLLTGKDTTLVAGADGVISAKLKEGPHKVLASGGFYDVSRMLVDKDIYPSNRQFLHGNDKAYLVSGLEGTPWLIDLRNIIKNHLYNLETLEISYYGKDVEQSNININKFLSAEGSHKIIQLLDKIVLNKNILFD